MRIGVSKLACENNYYYYLSIHVTARISHARLFLSFFCCCILISFHTTDKTYRAVRAANEAQAPDEGGTKYNVVGGGSGSVSPSKILCIHDFNRYHTYICPLLL